MNHKLDGFVQESVTYNWLQPLANSWLALLLAKLHFALRVGCGHHVCCCVSTLGNVRQAASTC